MHPYDNKHDWNQTINHMSSSHSMFWIVIKPSPIFFRKFFHSFFPKNTLRGAFYRGTGEDWNIKNNNIMPDTSKIGVKFYLLIIPTDTRYMNNTDRNKAFFKNWPWTSLNDFGSWSWHIFSAQSLCKVNTSNVSN